MPRAPREKFRLVYDGIELLPVVEGFADGIRTAAYWHLPGGNTATTKELIARAAKRGLQVQLLTIDGIARNYEDLS